MVMTWLTSHKEFTFSNTVHTLVVVDNSQEAIEFSRFRSEQLFLTQYFKNALQGVLIRTCRNQQEGRSRFTLSPAKEKIHPWPCRKTNVLTAKNNSALNLWHLGAFPFRQWEKWDAKFQKLLLNQKVYVLLSPVPITVSPTMYYKDEFMWCDRLEVKHHKDASAYEASWKVSCS
ncbi:hypothetical protein Tco_1263908 [Tanacetum coccineum]